MNILHSLIESNNLKNSKAIFQAGFTRPRVKHAIFDYEIQTKTAESGL